LATNQSFGHSHNIEAITDNRGTLERDVGNGRNYDFVAVASCPDLEAEFRSRNSVFKLGLYPNRAHARYLDGASDSVAGVSAWSRFAPA